LYKHIDKDFGVKSFSFHQMRAVRISVFGQVEVAVMGEKQMPATIAPKGF
jgi:hypothetical protein